MNEHHFNFLDQEDIRKRLGIHEPTQAEKILQTVRTQSVTFGGDIETKKVKFKAFACPDWAKLDNSIVVWDNYKEDTLAFAAKKIKVNISERPKMYYKPSLLDNMLLYESGYIVRHNEGASEIRRLNDIGLISSE
jgi:hypothetical protein